MGRYENFVRRFPSCRPSSAFSNEGSDKGGGRRLASNQTDRGRLDRGKESKRGHRDPPRRDLGGPDLEGRTTSTLSPLSLGHEWRHLRSGRSSFAPSSSLSRLSIRFGGGLTPLLRVGSGERERGDEGARLPRLRSEGTQRRPSLVPSRKRAKMSGGGC